MAAHDRIRLIGQLREGPAEAGPSYFVVKFGRAYGTAASTLSSRWRPPT
jgi:hypothetical protein